MDQRGFTIIEVLIATLIGAVVLLGLGFTYVSSVRFYNQSSSQTFLQRQGSLIIEEMARQIRPATGLTITTCSGVSGSLQVTNLNGTYCFRLNSAGGDQLFEDRPGGGTANLLSGSPVPLTGSSVSFSTDGAMATISFQLNDVNNCIPVGSVCNSMTFKTNLYRRN